MERSWDKGASSIVENEDVGSVSLNHNGSMAAIVLKRFPNPLALWRAADGVRRMHSNLTGYWVHGEDCWRGFVPMAMRCLAESGRHAERLGREDRQGRSGPPGGTVRFTTRPPLMPPVNRSPARPLSRTPRGFGASLTGRSGVLTAGGGERFHRRDRTQHGRERSRSRDCESPVGHTDCSLGRDLEPG